MNRLRNKAVIIFLLLTVPSSAALRAQSAATWRYVQKALDSNDETLLVNFAMYGVPGKIGADFHDSKLRLAAVSKLKNQPELMKFIASGRAPWDSEFDSINAALFNITDQTSLRSYIGHKENRLENRRMAVRGLTDQELLKEIALRDEDRGMKAAAISVLKGSEDTLRNLAGNVRVLATNGIAACARIRLILREPLLRDRFPDAEVLIRYATDSAKYAPATVVRVETEKAFTVSGESFRIAIRQYGAILAESYWSTYFAYNRNNSRPCEVFLQDLLVQLLERPCFAASDIAELSKSEFAELRESTDFFACHLHQARNSERDYPNSGLTHYAENIGKMLDRDRLAQLGQEIGSGDFSVPALCRKRLEAIKTVESIEDDAVLKNLALNNGESFIGLAAVEKIRDKETLLGLYLDAALWNLFNGDALLTAIQRKMGDQWLLDKGVFEGKGISLSGKTKFKGYKPAHRLIWNILDRNTLNNIILNKRVSGELRFVALVQMLNTHLGTPNYSK